MRLMLTRHFSPLTKWIEGHDASKVLLMITQLHQASDVGFDLVPHIAMHTSCCDSTDDMETLAISDLRHVFQNCQAC